VTRGRTRTAPGRARVLLAALVLFVGGCGTVREASVPPLPEGPPAGLELTFIIHGDGPYRFLDDRGEPRQADEVTLERARAVAESTPDADVLIFHEKPRRRSLLIFPRPDGHFYFYRGGRQIASEAYRRDPRKPRYEAAAALADRFRGESPPQFRMLLYFGHEIPETGGRGYDASYHNRTFTVGDFSDGLSRLSAARGPFDVLVLSTCFGGSPFTIEVLAPLARHIVASPASLHLSYFDLEPLKGIDAMLEEGEAAAVARRFAGEAFASLAARTQTVVSVASYDTEAVQAYLMATREARRAARATTDHLPVALLEPFDCADDPSLAHPDMSAGVEVLFRAPRFGRAAGTGGHSGWVCRRPLPSNSYSVFRDR
jgi:hypothetical protein